MAEERLQILIINLRESVERWDRMLARVTKEFAGRPVDIHRIEGVYGNGLTDAARAVFLKEKNRSLPICNDTSAPCPSTTSRRGVPCARAWSSNTVRPWG